MLKFVKKHQKLFNILYTILLCSCILYININWHPQSLKQILLNIMAVYCILILPGISQFKCLYKILGFIVGCILFLLVLLCDISIPININIIPYFSCRATYTMFDDKVVIDKIVFFNRELYVAPFAVPLFKGGKIKKLYLSTKTGFISIKDLNIYNIKNSTIDVEIKNINLHEVLNNNRYKDSYINGKILVKVDGNKIYGTIQDLIISNFNFNGINIGNLHINGTLESNDIKKDINCNIKQLIAKNIKIKDNSVEDIQFTGSYKSTDIKSNIDCNINQLITKNITIQDNSVGNIQFTGSFKSTDIKNNIDCTIKQLIAKNIKIKDNNVGDIQFTGSCKSTDIKNNIDCNIKQLIAKNIKIQDNSVGDIQFTGSCKSTDIKNNIDCNINQLIAKNIKVQDNSVGDIHFIGSCKSTDIKNNIDCDINQLIVNKIKLNDINLSSLKCNGLYKDGNINCNLDLHTLQHSTSCNGKILFGKKPEIDIILKSNTPLGLNNFKIKNNILLNTNIQYNAKWKYINNNNTIELDLKTLNNKVKNMNLGNISLQGKYSNNKLQCKIDFNKWNHVLNCSGDLKFNNKLKYKLNINSSNPLSLRNMNVSKDLSIDASGTYNINIQNTNKDFDINGNIKIYNGSLFTKGNIQYLKDINTNVSLNKSILSIDKFSATIPSFIHGKIELNGKLDLNPTNKFDAKCNLKLVNGIITNIPVVKGTVNADLNLTGSIIDNPLLKGNIILSDIKANLTPVLSGALLSTQMIEKFVNKDKKTKSNNKKVILSPINTDINIKIDKVLEANGPGLETTWNGNASIQCKKGNPINWNAKLSLVKGKYIIANKKLKLTSGECISSPSIPGLFTLTLAGRKKSNNDVVELKFIQRQNNTQIEFFSQPMKSKQDVLALLLFDKYNSELTSSEAYSLGMTIQSLVSGKGSIFSKINDTLKIDSIELKDNTDSSGEEYKSISIGKKIGKWKFNLERGKENDSTKISAERKIRKNFKANIGISKDSGLGASLMWSKRY